MVFLQVGDSGLTRSVYLAKCRRRYNFAARKIEGGPRRQNDLYLAGVDNKLSRVGRRDFFVNIFFTTKKNGCKGRNGAAQGQ